MGRGLALQFRLRYPTMYKAYRSLCARGGLDIGKLWLSRANDHWVLNFPTKRHWRQPTKEAYLHAGLEAFMGLYRDEPIASAAFPLLGAGHGGLDPARSRAILESYLCRCTIPTEVWIPERKTAPQARP